MNCIITLESKTCHIIPQGQTVSVSKNASITILGKTFMLPFSKLKDGWGWMKLIRRKD